MNADPALPRRTVENLQPHAVPDAPASAGPTEARSPAGRQHHAPPRSVWLAVLLLLAAYGVMSFTASLDKGVSFDEGQQLAVGYNLWLRGDYRIEGANGDLVKRWATLPYLWTRPRFVGTDDPQWLNAEPYRLADRFLFELANLPEMLLAQGRAMIALLGVAGGLLVFGCARELFGWRSGLPAVGLYSFSPHMLVFGGIVSTDLSITVTLLASTWCIWRLLHVVTPGRVAASLAAFGLLLLAKMTALVIFPITAVLLLVRFIAGGPMILRWGTQTWTARSRRAQAAIVLGLVLLHAAAGWGAIWAHYGFRYTASPNPADSRIVLRKLQRPDGAPSPLLRMVTWSREAHFLPEGYCKGIEWLLGDDDTLPAFMAGRWKRGGWRMFFPYTIWVKTQPALFLLLAIGAVAWWRSRTRRIPEVGTSASSMRYGATPHFVLIGVYLAIAVTEDINLGHRHVLPIYPSLYVLASAAALAWGRQAVWTSAAVAGLFVWRVGDSIMTRPNYLAYFGPQAGGSEIGYQHLVDSSLDWGMNLPSLKRWLDEHNPGNREPVFLSYFGTDSPEYHGIKSQRLPGFFEYRRNTSPYSYRPGYYAISATLFQGVYLVAGGRWNPVYENMYRSATRSVATFEAAAGDPRRRAQLLRIRPIEFWKNEYLVHEHFRFARLCAWLRKQGPPPDHVGHAIFIWKLDEADLTAALFGPPAELDPPSEWVRKRFGADH